MLRNGHVRFGGRPAETHPNTGQGAAGRPYTYVPTASGWAYVALIVDLYARVIVGWAASTTMTTKIVTDALQWALWYREQAGRPVTAADGLVHHSDHGSQYTSVCYSEELLIAGIRPSFGTVGDALDNALAEAVNGQYKAECAVPDGPFTTIDQLRMATAGWVHWYNNQRLHQALGYHTPAETEAAYYAAHQASRQQGQPLQTVAA